MRVAVVIAGLLIGLTGVAPQAQATPTELYLSEYVEGTSNNKALEVFNGTGAAVDLAAGGYNVQVFFNGSASAGLTINLTGSVAPQDVFVLAHSSAAAAILAQADQTSGAGFFNGDDAIVLRKATTVIDSIGQIGVDPGSQWGSDLQSTADNTLRRSSSFPDTDPGDPFDPAAQWLGFDTDTFDGLGSIGDPDPPADPVLTVGEVQGPGARSPLAPSSGNGSSSQRYDVQGVITQRTLARSSSGASTYGFFLQSRLGSRDGDPSTSDGIFVYMSTFTSLIGGYVPVVGDEVVLHARVSEFFNMTQLTSASLVRVVDQGVSEVEVGDAVPPVQLSEAEAFWERHEGMRMRVRSGSAAVSGRDVFSSTADAEIFLVDVDDPTLDRPDPLTRRVYRDAYPLDGVKDGNGNRIMLGSLGVKWAAQDNTAMLPPARTFDVLTADAFGGLYYSFGKYGIQAESVSLQPGADPSTNDPVTAPDRAREFSVATYNVENLYDYRDDPFDGCDFDGNAGCPGVFPPFDYVPSSEAEYREHLSALAGQIVTDLHAPDLLLVQEAEDQDICAVDAGALVCGATDDADGKPDTLQELALAITTAGGPGYDAAYDRDGADDRGITAAFLFRTDRLSLAGPSSVLTATPGVDYRSEGLSSNADVQNPKVLNAVLPDDVDRSTGVDGDNVYTRAPQVAKFTVAARPGGSESSTLWAISNHFSSTPQARVGQRTEQARYGAAIVTAIEETHPHARVVYGGDLNVFPRPDDPVEPPSDQLAPLYGQGLHNLWEDLVAQSPAGAYSYVYQGQAQTLDHLFVNASLRRDLLRIQAAHINADWPADHEGDGSRGASDHDPQVAVFRSRARLTVSDASATEGEPLVFTASVSRPLSEALTVCAATFEDTARQKHDYAPMFGCTPLAAGTTSVTFTVATRSDHRDEGTERLWLIAGADPRVVDLTDPVGAGTVSD